MGKRGPRPKGEYGRTTARTAVLSTRLQPDTRARLLEAAKANRRSLSQELEHRLRRTFTEDDKTVEFYGTEQTAAVVRLIGLTVNAAAARTSRRGRHEWLKEQWLFDDVIDAIVHTLLWFRPGGESGRQQITLSSTTDRIDELIDEIRSADPSPSMTTGSSRQHAMAMLKDKLGDLARHPHPYDEWLRKSRPVRIAIPEQIKRPRK